MKKIYILIFALLAMLMLTVAISAADVSVVASDGRVFEAEDTSFYLPSYISPSSVKLSHDGTKTITYQNASGERVTLNSGDAVDLTPFKVKSPSGQISYTLKTYVNGSLRTLYFYLADSIIFLFVFFNYFYFCRSCFVIFYI